MGLKGLRDFRSCRKIACAVGQNTCIKAGSGGVPIERNCFNRHCERSEAIQHPSAETPWIASLRSQ
jgi:hypothetical protein